MVNNYEMVKAYLDLYNGVFKLDKINDTKFHVMDLTVPYEKCGFDLEISFGHITCNGTDCIENMKSAFDNDQKMLRKIQEFENKYYHCWIKTDDLQYLRCIEPGQYQLAEARYVGPGDEDRFLIVSDTINLYWWLVDDKYDDDCISIIESYYSSVQEFEYSYPEKEDRDQILAEMIFEQTAYDELDWEIVEAGKEEDALMKRISRLNEIGGM